MSKSLKIFIIFLVGLVTLVISLTIAVNKKINTDHISLFVQSGLSQTFPGTKVIVGKVDFSMGTMIRVYINNVKVDGADEKLLEVKKITCKVPLLSTIFGKGTVKLKIDKPYLNKKIYDHFLFKKQKELVLDVPFFIHANKIDLSIHDFIVAKKNRDIKLNMVLLKNISLDKSMAYEVKSSINIKLAKSLVSAQAQLVGEVNLNKLNISEEIETNALLDLKEVKTARGVSLPRARSSLKLKWSNNNQQISGNGSISIDSFVDATFDLVSDFDYLNLSKIQASVRNDSLPKIFKTPFFKQFDYQKSITNIKGSLNYKFSTMGMSSSLAFNSNKPIRYTHKTIPFDISYNASVEDSQTNLKLDIQGLEGVIKTELNLKKRDEQYDYSLSNLSSITGNVDLSNIKFSRKHLKLFEKDKTSSKTVKVVEYEEKEKQFPDIKLDLQGKNNFVGDLGGELKMKLLWNNDLIQLKSSSFKTKKGYVKLTYLNKINEDLVDYKVEAKEIDLKKLVPIFPVLTPNLTGNLSLLSNGKLIKSKYSHDIKLKVQNFIIDFVNLAPPVNKFLTDIGRKPFFNSNERLNSFDLIDGKFELHDQGVNIKKSKVSSEKVVINISKAKIKKKSKSYVLGDLLLSKKKIPFRFTGFDHTLNPDLEYSKKKKK